MTLYTAVTRVVVVVNDGIGALLTFAAAFSALLPITAGALARNCVGVATIVVSSIITIIIPTCTYAAFFANFAVSFTLFGFCTALGV